jgi:hypothetical protein
MESGFGEGEKEKEWKREEEGIASKMVEGHVFQDGTFHMILEILGEVWLQ